MIYEAVQPEKAAVYSWWGYWIKAGELVASIVLYFALYLVVVVINKNSREKSSKGQVDFEDKA